MKIEIEHRSIEPCEHCASPLLFELSNGKEEYAVSLEAILVCLKIAEENGGIPAISSDWWIKIQNTYKEVRGSYGSL